VNEILLRVLSRLSPPVVLAVIVVLVLLLAAGSAQSAGVVFNADFNSDTVGNPPSTNPAGLPAGDSISLTTPGKSAILVAGPNAAFATNSARFTRAAEIGGSPILIGYPEGAPFTSGKYRVSWRAAAEQDPGFFGFTAILGSGGSIVTVNYFGSTISYQDASGSQDTGVGYDPFVAQQFVVEVDVDNRLFDLCIDGERVAQDRTFQQPQVNELDRFLFEIGGTVAEAYLLDDIQISDGTGACDAAPPTATPTTTPTATPATPTPTATPATPTPTQPSTPTPTPTPTPTATPTATPGGPQVVAALQLQPPPLFEPAQILPLFERDLRVLNIEVTQSIQCLQVTLGDTGCTDNQVPLVNKRFTWARVYVTNNSAIAFDVQNVPVRLTITKNGAPFQALNGTATAVSTFDREDLDASADFFFMCDCNNGDTLNFRAEVDPDDTITESNESNNLFPVGGTLNLRVWNRQSIDITAVPMRYNPPGPTDSTTPNSEINGNIWYLIRSYPVPIFDDPVTFSIDSVFTRNTAWNTTSVMNAMNAAYVTSGSVSPPDQVVLFVPGATGFNNGISDPLWAGGQGVVTMVDVNRYGAGAQPRVHAHEIGHNLGRRHPCTSGSQSDPSWPYTTPGGPAGLDFDIQETGIETDVDIVMVFIFPVPLFSQIVRPDDQTEMMQGGHCGETTEANSNAIDWPSPYTYQQLFCALSPTAATSLSCRQGNAVAMGSTAGVPSVVPMGTEGPAILVSGEVTAVGGGAIQNVYSLDSAVPSPAMEGPYCLELEHEGSVISTRCWEPEFDLPESAESLDELPFSVVLPAPGAADRIVLSNDSVELSSVELSPNAPIVNVTEPSTGGLKAGEVNVEWEASDADANELLFTVHYSHDGGQSLTPVVANITETSITANLDDLPGGDDAFFRVLATDNTGHTTSADSAHFEVANKAPVATILAPSDGNEIQIGNPVGLTGTASDREDSQLPEDAYAWTSSIDGEIANGSAAILSNLSPGQHTITLEVTDSGALTGSDSVEIFVGIPTWVDVKPDTVVPTLIAGAAGADIQVQVELPFGYDITDVDLDSLVLTVGDDALMPVASSFGDFDDDGLEDLTLTFDGAAFAAALPGPPGPAMVTLNGELDEGTPFRGSDLVSLALAGDANCDGSINPVDSLTVLRYDAGLPVLPAEECILLTADINCDGEVNPVDSLGILRFDAGLPVSQPEGCPLLGAGATVAAVESDKRDRGLSLGSPARPSTAWLGLTIIFPALLVTLRRRH
jgi:hypothetical protein